MTSDRGAGGGLQASRRRWAGTLRRCVALPLAVALAVGCGGSGDLERVGDEFAPTGAKFRTDEFGRAIFEDEECGNVAAEDYGRFFQNAMFRDGDVNYGALWTVDGSHLWALPLDGAVDLTVATAAGTPMHIRLRDALEIVVPRVGTANAVVAASNYLAVAVLDRGVIVYPYYDFSAPLRLDTVGPAVDVDGDHETLVVAAGDYGVVVYDMRRPREPTRVRTVTTGGFAAGVRALDRGDSGHIAVAACSLVAVVLPEDLLVNEASLVLTSPTLSHQNAKAIDGNDVALVAANNGRGAWVFARDTLVYSSRFDRRDPNFYANAVVVVNSDAYLAAGNQSVVRFPVVVAAPEPPQPVAEVPEDPVGLSYDGERIYGYGNFRDVGERTVLGLEPESLLLQHEWIEPLQPSSFATGAVTAATAGVLTRAESSGYVSWALDASAATWNPLTTVTVFGMAGTLAVTAGTDAQLRVGVPGEVTTTVLQPLPGGAGFVRIVGEQVVVGAGDGDLVIWRRDGGTWSSRTVAGLDAGPHGEHLHDVGTLLVDDLVMGALLPCDFINAGEQFGFSRRLLFGTAADGAGRSLAWCSRLVDPFHAAIRPLGDAGSAVYACEHRDYGLGACEPLLTLRDSGLRAVARRVSGTIGLVDDRRAYSFAIVTWDDDGAETGRIVLDGRPEGWAIDGDTVRVWRSDGALYDVTLGALPAVVRTAPPLSHVEDGP